MTACSVMDRRIIGCSAIEKQMARRTRSSRSSPPKETTMPDTIPPWLAAMRGITGTRWSEGDPPATVAGWIDFISRQYPDMARYVGAMTHSYHAWCGLTVAYCMATGGIRPPFDPA